MATKKKSKNKLAVHFSSDSEEWATPQALFDSIQKEFKLKVDVCATKENAKLPMFWSKKENGLVQDWKNKRCWMNPPYGRVIGDWIKKAATGGGQVVVALLPARTDTRWFHEYIYGKAEVRFIKGRLKFGDSVNSAPFPSMIVIWQKLKK